MLLPLKWLRRSYNYSFIAGVYSKNTTSSVFSSQFTIPSENISYTNRPPLESRVFTFSNIFSVAKEAVMTTEINVGQRDITLPSIPQILKRRDLIQVVPLGKAMHFDSHFIRCSF